MKLFVLPIVCVLSLLLLSGSPALADLSYEGSSSIGEQLLPELAAAFEKASGIKFSSLTSNDSTVGFKALIAEKTLLAGLSRLMTQEELQTEVANQPMGYDAIVIYVHKDNPVKSLTSEQLKNIFMDTIKNWQEVGGPDAPIETIVKQGDDEGGTVKQFRELLLEGKTFTNPTKRFPSHKENIDYVMNTPQALTFASLAFDEKKTPIIAVDGVLPSRETLNKGEYPLARPYVLVYLNKNAENPEIKKFLEFVLSKEGQEIVKKYVVPVMGFGE
jgi:phosphate transport system substrate-binding protein